MDTTKEDLRLEEFQKYEDGINSRNNNNNNINNNNNNSINTSNNNNNEDLDEDGDRDMVDINVSIEKCIKTITDDCKTYDFTEDDDDDDDDGDDGDDDDDNNRKIELKIDRFRKQNDKTVLRKQIQEQSQSLYNRQYPNVDKLNIIKLASPLLSPNSPSTTSSSLTNSIFVSPSSTICPTTFGGIMSSTSLLTPPSISPPRIPTPPSSISPQSTQSTSSQSTPPVIGHAQQPGHVQQQPPELMQSGVPPPPPPPPHPPSSSSSSSPPPTKTSDLAQIIQNSPTVRVELIPNGSLPKSIGKPMNFTSDKKRNTTNRNRSANTTKPTTTATTTTTNRTRGRPRQQRGKALVAMYQSQLTDNKIGIKLKLKKSPADLINEAVINETPIRKRRCRTKKVPAATTTVAGTVVAAAGSTTITTTTSTMAGAISAMATMVASGVGAVRKRRRRNRRSSVDSDDSVYVKRRRRRRRTTATTTTTGTGTTNKGDRRTLGSGTVATVDNESINAEQSLWASNLPENVLHKIFQLAVNQEGCLPTLVRLGKVCTRWHTVSLSSSLWHTLDLSTWTKDRFRTELKLKWLIENRLKNCQELNLANWKVVNVQCVLERLLEVAPNLNGITFAGWKELSPDHLIYTVTNFKQLQRIDLSSVNLESRPAVTIQSLCDAIQALNTRLTHLTLASNRLAGIPKIIAELSTHCPNLILLDLSNIQTIAVSHGVLHIEKLQSGCQKLKVLRITNSHITLHTATLEEQEESPGFPDLEELSIASVADESRLLITNEYFLRILKNSPKIKLLDIRGCGRLSHDCLIRLRAWDIKYLFLSGCSITRDSGAGLELIASKWAHSLTELDLAWANVQKPIDDALIAIAEKGIESSINHLNLCGSSVSIEAVKEILINCPTLNSINLSSCRGLPRGVKRLLQGPQELQELRDNFGVKLKYPKVEMK